MENRLTISNEFLQQMEALKTEWNDFYKKISNENTPKVDGNGEEIVSKRPDGYDYITEAYMRNCLDRHFPGWSWEMNGAPQFLGAEWVVVYGTLSIIDVHLLAFQVVPPIRKFSATNAARVKFGREKPHTPDNIVDIGNDVSGANSKAFKKAINQLTHIGDDVYGKRVEEEGAGSLDDMILANPNADTFMKWLKGKAGWKWDEIFKILGTSDLTSIENWEEATGKIKKAKGWK